MCPNAPKKPWVPSTFDMRAAAEAEEASLDSWAADSTTVGASFAGWLPRSEDTACSRLSGADAEAAAEVASIMSSRKCCPGAPRKPTLPADERQELREDMNDESLANPEYVPPQLHHLRGER